MDGNEEWLDKQLSESKDLMNQKWYNVCYDDIEN